VAFRDEDILSMWDEEFETHEAWKRYRKLLVDELTGGTEDDADPSEQARAEANRIWKDYVRVYASSFGLKRAYVLAATNGTLALLGEIRARDLD
jgi:hypothetical protein